MGDMGDETVRGLKEAGRGRGPGSGLAVPPKTVTTGAEMVSVPLDEPERDRERQRRRSKRGADLTEGHHPHRHSHVDVETRGTPHDGHINIQYPAQPPLLGSAYRPGHDHRIGPRSHGVVHLHVAPHAATHAIRNPEAAAATRPLPLADDEQTLPKGLSYRFLFAMKNKPSLSRTWEKQSFVEELRGDAEAMTALGPSSAPPGSYTLSIGHDTADELSRRSRPISLYASPAAVRAFRPLPPLGDGQTSPAHLSAQHPRTAPTSPLHR